MGGFNERLLGVSLRAWLTHRSPSTPRIPLLARSAFHVMEGICGEAQTETQRGEVGAKWGRRVLLAQLGYRLDHAPSHYAAQPFCLHQ